MEGVKVLDISFGPPIALLKATIHHVPQNKHGALVRDLDKIPGAGGRLRASTSIRLYVDRASSPTDPYVLICRVLQEHGLLFTAKTEVENIWTLMITTGLCVQSQTKRGQVFKSLTEIPGVLDVHWEDGAIHLKLECDLTPFLRKRIETNLRTCFV